MMTGIDQENPKGWIPNHSPLSFKSEFFVAREGQGS